MTSVNIANVAGYFLLIIICLLVVSGLFLNLYIVVINLNCWKKSPPLQSIDIIITSLAMVRIILLFLYSLHIMDLLSGRSVTQMSLFPEYTITMTLSVEFCSLWWGSVLCVFYCVKITNYSNRIFIRIKMNISKMVPWMLLISLVPSILLSLPYVWIVFSKKTFNGTDGGPRVMIENWVIYFVIRLSGTISQFVLSCISIGVLIMSLRRHTRNLDSQGPGFSAAQRDIHLSVIRSMASFLLFYVVYFVGSNLLPVSLMMKSHLFSLACFAFFIAFPGLHSASIIINNRRLKNSCPPMSMDEGIALIARRVVLILKG